jgi:phage repressor protein C with HTH and peptisase S24 domain
MVDKTSNIKERILQVAEYKGITKEKFFEKINMSYGNFKGKSKETPINSTAVAEILTLFPDVSPEWLLTGEGNIVRSLEILRSNNSEVNKITNYKPSTLEQLIPFWEVDFIAGNGFDAVDNKSTQPTYYMDIPDFRGCTAFKAFSDSMEGLIKSGSILFGTKVERWEEHLEFGQIYGIVCQDGRKYLKYIKKYRDDPKNYFLLESENKFYDEFEMPKASIRSIWLIHGHLSKRI